MSYFKKNLFSIINLNIGFFGLQYSFGLQQSNMSPIYNYLGASQGNLPLLWLAGPVTGLLIQPVIGAISDKTRTKWGNRAPYLFFGAIISSLCLFVMPLSTSIWMAAITLWILDAASNITMQPYRALISDKLHANQLSLGYLIQSAFTGLAQTLAYLTPTIFVLLGINKNSINVNHIPFITLAAFMTGGIISFSTIMWTLYSNRNSLKTNSDISKTDFSETNTFKNIYFSLKNMPSIMKQLWWMSLFQWYGIMCYWIYIVPAIAMSFYSTTNANSAGYHEAVLINGQIGSFYNLIAFLSALAMIPLTKIFKIKNIHGICLFIAGLCLISIIHIHSYYLLFVPMLGLGIAWGSIMGNPYAILASAIPKENTGVYMGIFNIFIVLPMVIQMLTIPIIYRSLLANNPLNVIFLSGVFLLIAGLLSFKIRSTI